MDLTPSTPSQYNLLMPAIGIRSTQYQALKSFAAAVKEMRKPLSTDSYS